MAGAWLSGSTAGRDLEMIKPLFVFITLAVVLALFLARDINILLIGEKVAAGMGQKIVTIKLLLGLSIFILAGSSVAAAGSIAFILFVFSLSAGSSYISPLSVLRHFLQAGQGEYSFTINTLRLPRALMAFLVGAALSVCFTGVYKGKRISTQGTGMGMPSISIYAK